MKLNAKYCAIKYIADAIRDEPINVAVAVWCEGVVRIASYDEALQRVLSSNSNLHKGSLDYFHSMVADANMELVNVAPMDAYERLQDFFSFPHRLTEERTVKINIDDTMTSDLEFHVIRTCDRLIELMVRPAKSLHTQSHHASPRSQVATKLKQFIQARKVHVNHKIIGGITREDRVIPFFANSGSNVGMDVVPAGSLNSLKSAKNQADRLCFQFMDILESGQVNRAVALIPFQDEDQKLKYDEIFTSRFGSLSRAKLVFDPATAVETFLGDASLDTPLIIH